MADDRSGGADACRDDRRRPSYVGRLLVLHTESMDELVGDLHADDLERLELRLAFEAWADAREQLALSVVPRFVFTSGRMDREGIVISSPVRNSRRVRAGSYEVTVTGGDTPWRAEGARKVRRPIHILTSRVQSHLLAQELRSRVHTHVDAEGAEAS